MEAIVGKLSRLFGITNEESETLIKRAMNSSTPQEDLLDLLGDASIGDIIFLLEEQKKKVQSAKKIQQSHRVISVEEKLDRVLAPRIKRNCTEYYDEYILETAPSSAEIPLVPTEIISKPYRNIFSTHYEYFNRVQSAVIDSVYKSTENVLVSAPTGAGKTDIAILAIVKQLEQMSQDKTAKIIYIAPMKALAAEITCKLRSRLPVLVSECTGDTELTREEMEKSTVLVCTPEKYDVSTRKVSSELLRKTALVVFDEIHILNDSRGPTIEGIVCRLKMSSSRNQKHTRLVGISATMPNPKDISAFLMVKPQNTHIFTPGDRPVPITYSIVGTRKNVDAGASSFIKRMDTKEKMVHILKEKIEKVLGTHNQAIVFVHTRANTLAVANILSEDLETDENRIEEAEEMGITGEMKEVYGKGVFIHNAGLPREIRQFAEEKFRNRKVRILVSTSTLAWGVNLPARTVIVFGTEIYVVEKGGYVDVDILNIQQMFGRAGRPQYDTVAEGVLITDHSSLHKYVRMLRVEDPIESDLLKSLPDRISAEIYLRNIKNHSDAVHWFRCTFLFVRMCKSPEKYGLLSGDIPRAVEDYIILSLNRLKELDFITAETEQGESKREKSSETVIMTDLGRIVSHYFLSESTIEEWNGMPEESTIISYLAATDEYKNILVRKDDRKDLGVNNIDTLGGISSIIKSGKNNSKNKNNEEEVTVELKIKILLDRYVQKRQVKGYSLGIDQRYILDNIERLLNGLSEYFLYKQQYEKVYKSLFLRRQLMRGAKTIGLPSLEISQNEHSLSFSYPVTGYIIIRKDGKILKITKIDRTKECYLVHKAGVIKSTTEIAHKDAFSGRIEVVPARKFSENELWIVDSSLTKIAGYILEYEKESAPLHISLDKKIQFKNANRIIVQEIPNVSYAEMQHLNMLLIYERIKEIKKKKERILVVVSDASQEDRYLKEYQKYSLIDGVSFEKDPLCLSSTNGIAGSSRFSNSEWTVGICSVDKLLKSLKYNSYTYIFSGFTRNNKIYTENLLKSISKNIIIYERPNVAAYIRQRYM
ncbi:activating signal cointegrator complex subunit 3 [Nematocida minor]|uniref:activating signal cointegrator complex subunit 3 n=1 Tax=Nematocida minor TaxID=1912983 RepID=UPI0022211EC7|nr:activating signal cointegrator complex subunit 3 [Nematocida minor]KAI5190665.1 activating signal cointegrator complex subunit 3 [Nematocida minor]